MQLLRLAEFLKEHPDIQHLPLDILLAHFFQIEFKTRKTNGDLAWQRCLPTWEKW